MGNLNEYCIQEKQPSKLNESACIEFIDDLPAFRGLWNFEKQSAYTKLEIAANQFCSVNRIDAMYVPIVSRLLAYRHNHYFSAFKSLPENMRSNFVTKLEEINVELMDSLFTHLIANQNRKINPFNTIENIRSFFPMPTIKVDEINAQINVTLKEQGLKLLGQKQVAIMIMVSGPSQCVQYTSKALKKLPIQGNPTMLQLLFKKLYNNLNDSLDHSVSNISIRSSSLRSIIQPIIVVCNSKNINSIKNYLQQKSYFGFDGRAVKVESIQDIPILNEKGKLCLTFQFKTLVNPQGTAKCLELLLDHKNYLRGFLKYHRVKYIHIMGIQNMAECPGDPLMLGLIHRLNRKIAAKCTKAKELYQPYRRYVRSQNKVHLLDVKELQFLNDLNLLNTAPVALNSIFFEVQQLLSLAQNNQLDFELAKRYHPKEVYCNYYDFQANKPVINGKCYIFQKDYRNYICASGKNILVQYNNDHFRIIQTQK